MAGLVLELQKEVMAKNCDVLHALRQAHVIAVKLKLSEFDKWIQSELHGYKCAEDEIPKYREVRGALKAFNPFRGWIPVEFDNNEIETMVCQRSLMHSLVEIIELCRPKKNDVVYLKLAANQRRMINSMMDIDVEMELCVHVSMHYVRAIIEHVRNCLLEWTLKLEAEGITGDEMSFSIEETRRAQSVPQQIYNYYGNVVNGNVSNSNLISGNENRIRLDSAFAAQLVSEVQDSLKKDSVSEEDKESILEMLQEISIKIEQNKKPQIIKAALVGLKDFLANVGANVTAAMITAKINGIY